MLAIEMANVQKSITALMRSGRDSRDRARQDSRSPRALTAPASLRCSRYAQG